MEALTIESKIQSGSSRKFCHIPWYLIQKQMVSGLELPPQ